MATTTFIGKSHGADYAYAAVYGSWWFVSLWALLAVTAVAYIVRRHVRRMSTLVLHLALLLILAGALLTHVSAWRGMVHLRSGVAVDTYSVIDGNGGVNEEKLPFTMRLDTFYVRYHDGTQAEADYVSHFTVTDGGRETQAEVSMNNIYRHGALRFYQSSYDRDGLGSVLAVNCDPLGIPVRLARMDALRPERPLPPASAQSAVKERGTYCSLNNILPPAIPVRPSPTRKYCQQVRPPIHPLQQPRVPHADVRR